MLSIQEIRDRKEELQKVILFKNKSIDLDYVINLDDQRKSLQKTIDDLKFEQKQAGQNKDYEKASSLKEEIAIKSETFEACKKELDALLWTIPNFVHTSVPRGKDESQNQIIKKVGSIPQFDFIPLDHQTLGEYIGMLDKEQAAKISGARFFYLFDDFAQLQYAIVQYAFSILTDADKLQTIIDTYGVKASNKPFMLVIPPTIVSFDTMDRMGRLNPMDDRYCFHEDKQVMVGSAEHCLGPLLMDQTIDASMLPIRYVAYTSSYRREAGSYGKDTKGILRTHEFHKIEMESFALPEDGMGEQDLMVAIQEYLVDSLGLAYQVLNKCTGDVGDMDYRAFDIETYIPTQETYRETHTADYMTDYQARRLQIKAKMNDGTKTFVHMNDATVFALGRILVAIIENYQQQDKSIRIPDVLVPFMNGKTHIKRKQ